MKRTYLSIIFLLCLCGPVMSSISHAGIAIIANKSIAADTITTTEASNLFLAKKKVFGNDIKLQPIDQKEGREIRLKFYKSVTGKTQTQLAAYWARLVFTGRGTPNKAYPRDSRVLELIAEDDTLIGYIDSSSVDDSVKVLLVIE